MSEDPPHIPTEGEQLPEEPSQPIGVWHGHSGNFPVLEVLGKDTDPEGNELIKIKYYSVEVEDGIEVRKEHEGFAPSGQLEIYSNEPAKGQESFTQALWRKSEAEPAIPVLLHGHQHTYLGEKYWARLPDGTEGWLNAEEIDLNPASGEPNPEGNMPQDADSEDDEKDKGIDADESVNEDESSSLAKEESEDLQLTVNKTNRKGIKKKRKRRSSLKEPSLNFRRTRFLP
jgi:hypothetical protein